MISWDCRVTSGYGSVKHGYPYLLLGAIPNKRFELMFMK